MNPVDHPHGGGEGKSGQGNPHPVTPWGWKTKGYKTRRNKRTDSMIVRDRRQNATQGVTRRASFRDVMSRSIKKGPFVDNHLLAQGREGRGDERPAPDQDLRRAAR